MSPTSHQADVIECEEVRHLGDDTDHGEADTGLMDSSSKPDVYWRSDRAPLIAPPSPQPVEFASAPGRRWRRVGAALVVVGLIACVAFNVSSLAGVLLVFVLVVPFEKWFPRHVQPLRRPAVGTDLAYALSSGVLSTAGVVVGFVIAVASLAWLPGLILRPVVSMLPPLPMALLGVILFDVSSYWVHRFVHEVPFLWRFHSIHHSTRHLDWVSGFRGHPLDGVLVAAPAVFLIAAGFPLQVGGVIAIVQLVTGLFLHANVRWRLRRLQKVVITPEFHHWHHANEVGSINTNYSTFLPLWDVVFGTYSMPRDRRPQSYGVSEPVPERIGPQLWHPFRGLRNPVRVLRHPGQAVRETACMIRRGIRQMASSARRPTRSADRSFVQSQQ